MSNVKCPKCGYQRRPGDDHVLAGICPACGIAYQKWLQRQKRQPAEEVGTVFTREPRLSALQRIKSTISEIPEAVDAFSFWGRGALFVLFFCWGWWFIFAGIDWTAIGGSFLHNVNLPFHEFGHVLFSPFGRFMSILGGSLFQVTMPLGLMLAFILKHRDNFAASLMLWWSGQNFIDVSPYIADAPYRAIPLIGGLDESAHDWGNLLTITGDLDSAMTIARFSFGLGVLFIVLSYVWGGYILYLYRRAAAADDRC